jgi:glucose/mannose-6-phosphate isomerase
MLERVRGAASQLESVLSRPQLKPSKRPYDRVLILGTGGGSAMAGEALKRLFDRPGRPSVDVCGEYRPPAWLGPRSLVFVVSHSGRTKETLAAAKAAARMGASLCALTAGGPLLDMAERSRWPVWRLSPGDMPRALFYEILGALLRLLGEERELRAAARDLAFGSGRRERAALDAAEKLRGLIPYALGAEPTGSVAALRLKNQLAENAKRISFASAVPRAHHDEIVGWSRRDGNRRFGVVILRGGDETPELERRLSATRALLAPRAGAVVELRSDGKRPLSRLTTLVQTCDFLSVHAALLDGVAPTPVALIDELKRRMR